MSEMSAIAITAIAAFVACVEIQGSQPARIIPTGRRCCSRNR